MLPVVQLMRILATMIGMILGILGILIVMSPIIGTLMALILLGGGLIQLMEAVFGMTVMEQLLIQLQMESIFTITQMETFYMRVLTAQIITTMIMRLQLGMNGQAHPIPKSHLVPRTQIHQTLLLQFQHLTLRLTLPFITQQLKPYKKSMKTKCAHMLTMKSLQLKMFSLIGNYNKLLKIPHFLQLI